MENFKAIFDLTKLPTKFFLLFAVCSSLILFTPQEFLQRLNLKSINEEYGWIIGLTFILSWGLVIVNFIIWLYDYVNVKLKIKKYKRSYSENMKKLDFHEKAVLREFFINSQSSINVPIDNPTISGLLNKNIIVMNRQFGDSTIMTNFMVSASIHEYALKFLLLDDIGLKNNMTEKEKRWVTENRPDWAYKLRF